MAFADFLKAAALLSPTGEIIFRNPELSMPIHFSSWQPDYGDPIAIQLVGDGIVVDTIRMDEAALEMWAKRFMENSKLIKEPALVVMVASDEPPVSFQNGLQVLRILADNGIDLIVLTRPESDAEQSARIEQESKPKPNPPAFPVR